MKLCCVLLNTYSTSIEHTTVHFGVNIEMAGGRRNVVVAVKVENLGLDNGYLRYPPSDLISVV